ncbi:uncharacterized protein B0H18DRAFT_1116070 [Fomitopsis serialis]|uniref:uncharacterized protein n=1 Tax=Fomitopsis serialis TaxID=139415 RepID=UPI00200841CC|nr:uncharacterized protein B0H18DRAFT_1116070 [Neoantrodia serialis]KAH9931809.1 hypothetical protein B0H18DRAFT_1116070 [Neoantrodia serialis]
MSGRGKGGKGLGKGGAKRHRKILRDNIQGGRASSSFALVDLTIRVRYTKPAIRRLARRGGVKRISGLIYEETRGVLKIFLENVIRDSVTYTEHAKRKTVTALDVVYALKRSGRTSPRLVLRDFSVLAVRQPYKVALPSSSDRLTSTPSSSQPPATLSSSLPSPTTLPPPPRSCMDLPVETLYAIFDHLQPRPGELAQVARVCQRFRVIAERILYAHIFIQEGLPRSSPFPHRVHRCCDTLLARPDLHDVVRRLTVRWQTDPSARDQYEPFVQPVLLSLNRTLRFLTQLESLDLALGLVGVSVSVRSVLSGCYFPGLRLFALYGIGPGSIPVKDCPDALVLQHFLSATRTLEHLVLGDHYAALALAPHDLPLLAAFKGTATAAASIVPGRAVTHLTLVGQDQFPPRLLAELAFGREPIRTLDLSAVSVTPNTLKAISCYLSGVVDLKIRFALRHTLHHSFTGITLTLLFALCPLHTPVPLPLLLQSILAGLCPVLAAFPVLRLLDLSATPALNDGLGSSLEEVNLCQMWGRSCPSLRAIVFPSKTEWASRPRAHLGVQEPPAVHEELG